MSPPWKALSEALASAALTEAPVLLYGEAGTGKLAAARALHAESRHRDLVILDLASVNVEGEQQWLRRFREALSADNTVVLAHLHLCHSALAGAVSAAIGTAGPQSRLVGTMTIPHPQAAGVAALLDRFCVRLPVPTLRDRSDDIEALVLCFIRRHAGGRPVTFLPESLRALRSVEIVDNVRGLERIVAAAVGPGISRPTLYRKLTSYGIDPAN